MSGDSDFTLRLIQDVSGPALAAKKSIQGLGGEFRKLGIDADAAWKKSLAAAKSGMAKEHGASKLKAIAADQKALRDQVRQAKQLSKDKERAELLAGKQAARNLNLQAKADAYHQKKALDQHNLKLDTDHARMGGFDAGELAAEGSLALGAALAAGAAAAAVAVGYLGYEFIKAAEAASEFQQSSIKAIGYLTDNAPAAEGVFDDVRKDAQALGLDVHDTVDSFQKLLAAQFSVGQSKQLIKMGADMQAIGADAEHVQRILYAMSEIKSMGTLQKRQERMLQMAGISGKLIDEALMKRMHLTDHKQLEKARKKNTIGADVAVEAIKDAVMLKTHEQSLGDVATKNADNTLKGMRRQFLAWVDNLQIDVGKTMEPVLVNIAQHMKDLVGKISNDPKIAAFGRSLLLRWEQFGDWVDKHWPQIESTVIGALHGIGDAVVTGFEVWQSASSYWDDAKLALEGLVVPLAAVAIGGLLLVAPFMAATAVVGGLLVGMMLLEGYVVESIKAWFKDGQSLGANLVDGIINGLFGGIPDLIKAGISVAQAAHGAITTESKIQSPSRVTYEMGGYLAEGLALGMDDSHHMVKSSGVSLAGASLDGMASGGNSSTRAAFAPVFQIHQQPGEDGEDLAHRIARIVHSEFNGMLDGLAIEGSPVGESA